MPHEISDQFYNFFLIFCTLFAGCLGSFANVVIYRVPRHMSVIWPPSTCPKCNARIRPYDNIPVISWILLGGRCRKCKNPISKRYPIIELICALLGLFLGIHVFNTYGVSIEFNRSWILPAVFVYQIVFVVACLILAIIDYETTEIPPEIALPVAALGIGFTFLLPGIPFSMMVGYHGFIDAVLGAFIGGGLIVAIIGLYYLATKRIGMGGGDVWMMVMVGACLGWQSLAFVLFAASLQGIVIALGAIALGKKTQQTETQQGLFRNRVADEVQAEIETGHSEAAESPQEAHEEIKTGKLAVPFGPFIALAAIEYIFFGQQLLMMVTDGSFLRPY